ncbi:hypothetical protein Z945_3483 [Sulfitobacter noctilucae]|nr:hypothetical protein Z945_3483 [Sulfitobacter noctilucae]
MAKQFGALLLEWSKSAETDEFCHAVDPSYLMQTACDMWARNPFA